MRSSKPKDLTYILNISVKDLYNEVKKKVKIKRTRKYKRKGYIEKQKTFNLAFYEREYTLEGEGNCLSGYQKPGDVIFYINAKDYCNFSRINDFDILMIEDLSFENLYKPFLHKFIHLDGKEYCIEHDNSTLRENGIFLEKFSNLGLPYQVGDKIQRGTLYVQYRIVFSKINR